MFKVDNIIPLHRVVIPNIFSLLLHGFFVEIKVLLVDVFFHMICCYPVLQFFRTEPLPCDPSSLPKYAPSKEFDAKLRNEEERKYGFKLVSLVVSFLLYLITRLIYIQFS